MNNKSQITMDNTSAFENITSWVFGVGVLAAGLINTFWGNDPEFGIFIALLSFVYFLPVAAIFKRLTGVSIPRIGILKIILGVFIIWAVLGVGELFEKIALMKMDL